MSSYKDDDFMEMGNTGWIPVAEGWFMNRYTRHMVDEMGNEYDENGNIIVNEK